MISITRLPFLGAQKAMQSTFSNNEMVLNIKIFVLNQLSLNDLLALIMNDMALLMCGRPFKRQYSNEIMRQNVHSVVDDLITEHDFVFGCIEHFQKGID